MAISSTTEVSDPDLVLLIDTLRQAFNSLGVAIEALPAGRRRSVALTHLETAAMYAIKAAAVGDR